MVNNKKRFYRVFEILFDEYKTSQENCWLEIVRSENGTEKINFVHFHPEYKSKNKWLAIDETYPESFERFKNIIINVLRGKALIKKGL